MRSDDSEMSGGSAPTELTERGQEAIAGDSVSFGSAPPPLFPVHFVLSVTKAPRAREGVSGRRTKSLVLLNHADNLEADHQCDK